MEQGWPQVNVLGGLVMVLGFTILFCLLCICLKFATLKNFLKIE